MAGKFHELENLIGDFTNCFNSSIWLSQIDVNQLLLCLHLKTLLVNAL